MNSIEREETIKRKGIFLVMMGELLDMCQEETFALQKIENHLRGYLGDFEHRELMEIQKNYLRGLSRVKQSEKVRQVQQEYREYFIQNHRFRNRSLLLAASKLSSKQRRFSHQELVGISESIPAGIDFRYPTSGTIPVTPASDFLSAMFIFSQNRPRDGMSKRLDLLRLMNSHKLFF